MKKYLFGLGAMLVGAGLMFVLMHGEVSAEDESNIPEPFVCSESTQIGPVSSIKHCETKTLDCAVSRININGSGVSCLKKGGIFK